LPLVHLEVSCSAGTYIRTLCADIGTQLGCGGHLLALRRTQSSGFTLQQAISLLQLEKLAQAREVNGSVISMTDALVDMPEWRAGQKLIKKIRHGQPIHSTDMDLERLSEQLMEDGAHLKVVDANDALLAVLRYDKSRDKLAYACVFQNSTMQEQQDKR
jgi:tRNA pseudouridine55 synthase